MMSSRIRNKRREHSAPAAIRSLPLELSQEWQELLPPVAYPSEHTAQSETGWIADGR